MTPTLSLYNRIVAEQVLIDNAEASIDSQGSLLIVADATLPEASQQFVFLSAEAVRNLESFLATPKVMEVIRA